MGFSAAEKARSKIPDSLLITILVHNFIGWGFLRMAHFSTRHLKHNGGLRL